MGAAIELLGVERTFRENRSELHALGPVTLSVAPGEFLCLLGPTGCGKTTLLRILAGLDAPDAGRVVISPRPARGKIGYVFQEGALFPWLTALDNVAFPLRAMGKSKHEARKRAEQSLFEVGLESFETSHPHQLSGGMRQRVALARGMVADPDVLLLDEPFSSLDAETSRKLQKMLRQLVSGLSATVVFVTHNTEEAVFLGHRICVMGNRPGTIIRDETLEMEGERDRLSSAFTELFRSFRG